MNSVPECSIEIVTLGKEQIPVMVIDSAMANPERLRDDAQQQRFESLPGFFPGVRAPAPIEYQKFVIDTFGDRIADCFSLNSKSLKFTLCHYSLVTTPPERLSLLQRIPHFDSLESNGLAAIHYLFLSGYGGTAFYRHRKTGFERINEARKLDYFRSLESENDGPLMPGREYINGSTPLFEEIGRGEGVYNRMLIYPRNLLHSGCIEPKFQPDPNPATGRLSINSFIDVL